MNYAIALNDLLSDNDCTAVKKAFTDFMSLLDNDQLQKILSNPTIDFDFKEQLVEKLFINQPELLKIFLLVVIKNKDFKSIVPIYEHFIKLVNKRLNIAEVQVYSANELSDEYRQKLIPLLEKKIKQAIHPYYFIDKTLLGGIRVICGDRIIDYSVASQLAQLKATIKEDKDGIY